MPNLMASFLAVLGGRWSHPGADSLSQHLDGSLSPRRQGQVARHLDGCERCRAELESLRLTVGLLQRVPQVEPGRSFVFAAPPLVEALPRAQRVPNWGLGAAGASLVLLLAVLVSADMAGECWRVIGPGASRAQKLQRRCLMRRRRPRRHRKWRCLLYPHPPPQRPRQPPQPR